MSETKHTPRNELSIDIDRPFSCQIDGFLLGERCIIYDEGGLEQSQAEFIVTALNAHDDLVAALNKLSSWLICGVSGITSPEDMAQSYKEMYDAAEAVLAKAK